MFNDWQHSSADTSVILEHPDRFRNVSVLEVASARTDRSLIPVPLKSRDVSDLEFASAGTDTSVICEHPDRFRDVSD